MMDMDLMAVLLGVLKWTGLALLGLIAAFVLGSIVLPPLTRGMTDRWGATDAEVAAPMPGDELIPGATAVSTKAVTVDAPPPLVYALLVQMGYQRGGWYGWDWFYHATGSSEFVDGHHTRRIDPELQTLAEGDRVFINKPVSYRVLGLKRPASDSETGEFVMHERSGAKMQHLEPDETDETVTEMSWVWLVTPVDDGRRSRLVLRIRGASAGYPPFLDWLFDKPLDFGGAIMGYKTLQGIRRTAEGLAGAGVTVDASGRQVAGPEAGLD